MKRTADLAESFLRATEAAAIAAAAAFGKKQTDWLVRGGNGWKTAALLGHRHKLKSTFQATKMRIPADKYVNSKNWYFHEF